MVRSGSVQTLEVEQEQAAWVEGRWKEFGWGEAKTKNGVQVARSDGEGGATHSLQPEENKQSYKGLFTGIKGFMWGA